MSKMAFIDLIDCLRASDEFRPMNEDEKKKFNTKEKDPLITRSETIMGELHTIILDGTKIKILDDNLKLTGYFTLKSWVV